MIYNGESLLKATPIKNMSPTKNKEYGVSWGLSEVGYDIRVKEQVTFIPPNIRKALIEIDAIRVTNKDYLNKLFYGYTIVKNIETNEETIKIGRTALASSVEEFQIPNNLWGELRNKSSHARRFFDATLGTDMEPGWKGFLTIEIIFHDLQPIIIPANSAIAKSVFHQISNPIDYVGKYQNQESKPIPFIYEE